MLRELAEDPKAVGALKAVGPEIFYKAPSGDFVGGLI
jgi:hypothetical protein